VIAFQKEHQVRLDKVQQSQQSGIPWYSSRVIDTYAHKIEVFDASLGSFPLDGARYEGARYHHVSVDLQMHVKEPKEEPKVDDDDLQMPAEELEEPEEKGMSSRTAQV